MVGRIYEKVSFESEVEETESGSGGDDDELLSVR